MRWLRTWVVLVLLGLLGATSTFLGFVTALAQDLPDIDQFEQKQLEQDGAIYAHGTNGRWVRIATLRSPETRVVVGEDAISDAMKHAIVAIEDQRFYSHRGVDPEGVLRAVVKKVASGSTEGGSTITQQFVKNVYLSNEQTLQRKLREAAIAYQLEQRWSKDKILAEYLNTVNFGNGCYGIEIAARCYFGKSAKDLRPSEAALLAAIPRSPTAYDPVRQAKAARERRNLVLDKMVEQEYLTPEAGAVEKSMPLLPAGRKVGVTPTKTAQPFFVDYVIEQLKRRYGTEKTFGGGLKVYTTLDLAEQRLAERSVKTVLAGRGPQGSLVSIEPSTGRVKAMVGGWKYGTDRAAGESLFNVATSGRRQPGSSFKPFVLLAALDRGIQTSTEFVSKRQVFALPDSSTWVVSNDSNVYLGPISLSTAVKVSDNTVFAQLTRLVGPAKVAEMAKRLGIISPLDSDLAIGLGGLRGGVTPLEMAHAYATIANGGERVGGSVLFHTDAAEIQDPTLDPITIEKVVVPGAGPGGKARIDDNAPKSVRVVAEASALSALDAMRAVLDQDGTGRRAAFGRPAAGKTGTTEFNRDAWFAGMTPQRATAVWVGYVDTARPMETEFGGEAVKGGTFPALIWHDFMQAATRRLPYADWPRSPGVPNTVVAIDSRNWELAPSGCPYARALVLELAKVPAKTSRCSRVVAQVPSYVGYTLAQMRRRVLDEVGVTIRLVPRPAAAGETVDMVVDQEPEAYRTVPTGTVVTVFVSQEVTRVVVPDVLPRTPLVAREAIARLEAARFRVRIVDGLRKRGVPGSRVVGQDPRPGAPAPLGSVITIRVTGQYRSGVLVPKIEGVALTRARAKLERLGLTVVVRRPYGRAKADDVVYRVEPEPTSLVPAGSSVLLVTDPRRVADATRKASKG